MKQEDYFVGQTVGLQHSFAGGVGQHEAAKKAAVAAITANFTSFIGRLFWFGLWYGTKG